MQLVPRPDTLPSAAANVFDAIVHGGLADLRPTPRRIIDEAPKRTVYRYLDGHERGQDALPVLLVPPLAAPSQAFDLRRGCSLAAHLMAAGHPTYLLEYGHIAFSDRDLGLEHWVRDIIPAAVRRVSDDAGGLPVQLVGWCLGGIMALLAEAHDPELPVMSVAMVASPFDSQRVRAMSLMRPVDTLTRGLLGTAIYRALGGAPAPLVKRAFQLTSLDKYLTRPLAILTHLDDREFLAQMEAVDRFTDSMHAYPGRTMGQLYHLFFRVNEIAGGTLTLGGTVVELAEVRVPVLAVAGDSDVIAPRGAVHHVAELLPNAPEVRLRTGPGGHLGVLAGRAARETTWVWLDEFLAGHEPPHAALQGAA